jgi:hypothetical protein
MLISHLQQPSPHGVVVDLGMLGMLPKEIPMAGANPETTLRSLLLLLLTTPPNHLPTRLLTARQEATEVAMDGGTRAPGREAAKVGALKELPMTVGKLSARPTT